MKLIHSHAGREEMTTRTISQLVEATRDRWSSEAELNFARRGRNGEKMHRELWANGQVMVGHEGALPNQMVPLSRAIEIYRAGWKVTR